MPVVEEVNDDATGSGHSGSGDRAQTGSSGSSSSFSRLMNFVSGNKIEALLWISRLMTVFSTFSYFLPFLGGHPHSYYQKALLSNGVTSALRLHQRVPRLQFSREYLAQLFLEDSAHYLFYSLIFVTGPPVSMALLPVFLYAVMHAQSYTKQLLNIESNQVSMLRFIACSEIFLMPMIIFLILSQLFYELRVAVEVMCSKPQCPQFVANICYKSIGLICRVAPTTN